MKILSFIIISSTITFVDPSKLIAECPTPSYFNYTGSYQLTSSQSTEEIIPIFITDCYIEQEGSSLKLTVEPGPSNLQMVFEGCVEQDEFGSDIILLSREYQRNGVSFRDSLEGSSSSQPPIGHVGSDIHLAGVAFGGDIVEHLSYRLLPQFTFCQVVECQIDNDVELPIKEFPLNSSIGTRLSILPPEKEDDRPQISLNWRGKVPPESPWSENEAEWRAKLSIDLVNQPGAYSAQFSLEILMTKGIYRYSNKNFPVQVTFWDYTIEPWRADFINQFEILVMDEVAIQECGCLGPGPKTLTFGEGLGIVKTWNFNNCSAHNSEVLCGEITRPPFCDTGGPYTVEFTDGVTEINLSGLNSFDPEFEELTYFWEVNNPDFDLAGEDTPEPTLTVFGDPGFDLECEVTLTVSDGKLSSSCITTVRVVSTAQPEISIENIEFEFPNTNNGETVEEIFQIDNIGSAPLEIISITLSNEDPSFIIIEAPFEGTVIDPGGSEYITIKYSPLSNGNHSVELQILTNDKRNPLLEITLSGSSGHIGDIKTLFRRGDCNSDGLLDVSDSISLLEFQFLGTFNPSCKDSCDYDDNGLIDVTDPIATLSYLFLGKAPPTQPGIDSCGSDPSEDELNCDKFSLCLSEK